VTLPYAFMVCAVIQVVQRRMSGAG
jgi:hypothetical protein